MVIIIIGVALIVVSARCDTTCNENLHGAYPELLRLSSVQE